MALNSTFSAASINGWRTNDYIDNPWKIRQIIVPSNNVYQDFGYSFATTSDFSLIVVGAPTYSGPGIQRGIVYIYSGSPTTGYTELQTIQSNDIANFDAFGFSVDVSEDKNYIVVGATSKTGGSGGAYVFVKSGSTYVQQQSLTSPGSTLEQIVSIDSTGTYLVIGSPAYDSGGNTNNGIVSIYNRTGTTWSNVKTYVGTGNNIRLGISVYINAAGDFIWYGDQNDASQSRIWRTTRSGATWSVTPLSTVMPVGGTGGAYISASGDNQYIGVIAGNSHEFAYVRKYIPDQWAPQATLASGSTTAVAPTITNALPIISNNRYLMSGPYLYEGLNTSWSLTNTFYNNTGNILNGPSSIDSTGTYFAGTIYNATINGVAHNGALYIFTEA